MKLSKSSFLLISMLWLTISSCGQQQKKAASIDQDTASKIVLISPNQLEEANNDILLIDVRTPEEYAAGHIENSINIDYKSDRFKEVIGKLNTDQEVYVYCLGGFRSANSAKIMKDMGFEKIYDLEGGIRNWQKQDKKVVK